MSYYTGGFPEQREVYTTVFSDFGMILLNDLKRGSTNLTDQPLSKKICLQKQTVHEKTKRQLEYDSGCKRQKLICA